MVRGRASFSTDSDHEGESESPSTSRERDSTSQQHADAATQPAAPRRTSFSTVVHIPADIYEEPDHFENESSALMPDVASGSLEREGGSSAFSSPRKRGQSYGSFATGPGPDRRFLSLNPTPSALTRNESVFKLSGMINDKGGDFEKFRMSEVDMKGMKKSVREFYRTQNEILDGFAEVDEILDNTRMAATTGELAPVVPTKPSADREEAFNLKVKFAINVNFLVNFLLLGAKIAIVLISSSMSLIASTVDSAMDFLSTLIIYGTSRIIDHKGKQRMEPMGIVVFSVCMIASFLQVFIESAQRLIDPHLEPAVIPIIGKIVMAVTIGVKLIVFNFFSLLAPLIGEQIGWAYLDPLGGALLSIYIIVEWTRTLLETIQKLTGKRATPQEHQRVAYLLVRFSPLIKAIQHLSVYHTGDSYNVVLPHETTLTIAHNVAESAQYGLEQLERVDRAFVHVDITVNPLSGHVPR
ncbi:hypothetical protein RQP46_009211 [Phenoliferia psychrophenolica]